tara:strand:- start:3352 stop:4371 length:1020 start_codon:yes stop_codon:yes gene_type:complete
MKNMIKKTTYLALLFSSLVSVSHASLLITANQSVNVSGKYLPAQPANIPDPRIDISTSSYNGNSSSGISQFDFELGAQGIDEGLVSWDIGIENARLSSNTELRIKHDFISGPSFTDLQVDVSNKISYGDTITVRDLSPGQNPVPTNLYVRFQVDLTGDLLNNVNYDNPSDGGASLADYYTNATFFSQIANSGGDANEDWQVEETSNTHSNGRFGTNVNETATMNSSVIFEDLLWRGQAIFFDWAFSEMFNIDIDNIDVGSIDIHLQNDLSHTIITRASVFDANGNWMPNYVIESSDGFDYAQISSVNPTPPVNAPSLAGLLLCSFIGMLLKNGRRTYKK